MTPTSGGPGSEAIRPQPGPQARFLACDADIAVYGGAAGGGKTYGLLLDPLRYVAHPGFRGVIFRRTYPQVTEGGGLWDTAMEVYPRLGGRPNRSALSVAFPSGARVSFRHLQYDQTVYNWQGAQVPWVGFDEGTHFTERQVLYLLSRNRSTAGLPCRLRVTCNPDAESWLAGFLAWWIGPDGYPDPARAGAVRWVYRVDDEFHWHGSRVEAELAHPDLARVAAPKSVAFVPSTLDDNPILARRCPEYRANLLAQSRVERERLLGGNWRVTAADGMFRGEWFRHGEPKDVVWKRRVRAWDLAATEPTNSNDPDYAVGVLMGQEKDTTRRWVLDVQRVRVSPQKIQQLIKDTAARDGTAVEVVVEQEPGASGKIVADNFRRELAGYRVVIDRPDKRTGDKVTRAHGYSAAVERGEVYLAPGTWVRPFVGEHVQFPFGSHDDQVDAAATAFRTLSGTPTITVGFGKTG